ncbi:hypothetical protein [Lysinibacillus sp. Bpr_S20]|uniref:hypothetical protein n=1 Tax=Lysinibacillus sp. Bpr_S20 TaxID=2933964 RepID=UPI0020122C88|nr:hypothetical protein [Lysinibacillus sp. Bpr_S20]MCL1701192.1 hypothetical protein [Lysinibacillus sp. Bpr_S20]
MTKKSGLFDVDFSLTTKELTASIKGEKSTAARYKLFSEAVRTIISQEVSGYRLRTIKDYDTVLMNFSRSTGVTYLEKITVDTIYSRLDSMHVVNQTKLTRLKVLKSFLGKCFTNGWLSLNFWQLM